MNKLSVVLFLSEVLSAALKEEEANPSLFQFLSNSLSWFDVQDNVANFHIFFLLSLTKHLGFFPDINHQNLPYFDLENGCFTAHKSEHLVDDATLVSVLKSYLGTTFDEIERGFGVKTEPKTIARSINEILSNSFARVFKAKITERIK